MRYSLLTENWFIMATSTPSIPIHRPRSIWPRDRAAMTVRAKRSDEELLHGGELDGPAGQDGSEEGQHHQGDHAAHEGGGDADFQGAFSLAPQGHWVSVEVVHTDDGVPGMLMRMAGTKPPEMPPT